MAKSRADELKEEIEREDAASEEEKGGEREHPDAAIMKGGPGTEDIPRKEEETIKTETVVIGGVDYEMSPEAANAYKEEVLSRQASPSPDPIQETPVSDPVSPAGEETDWDSLLFTNPTEAVRLIKEQAVEEAKSDIRKEYDTGVQRNNFWTTLYEHSPELKGEEALIQSVMQQNAGDIGHLTGQKAVEKVSDLTKATIMRLSGKYQKDRKTETNETETLENASPVRRQQQTAPEEDSARDIPDSLGKVLKLRSKRRRAGTSP